MTIIDVIWPSSYQNLLKGSHNIAFCCSCSLCRSEKSLWLRNVRPNPKRQFQYTQQFHEDPCRYGEYKTPWNFRYFPSPLIICFEGSLKSPGLWCNRGRWKHLSHILLPKGAMRRKNTQQASEIQGIKSVQVILDGTTCSINLSFYMLKD